MFNTLRRLDQDVRLERMESRWRFVGGVVLVLAAVAAVLVTAWVTRTNGAVLVSQWDWVFAHHRLLTVLLGLALVAIGAVAFISWRRSSWQTFGWAVAPLVVVVLLVGAWVIADRRSNVADIAGRVHQVESVLPPGAVRATGGRGDNLSSHTYLVHDDLASVSTAAREKLGRGVWADPKQGDAPTTVEVSYTGRDGCDGSVEVDVQLTANNDGTTRVVVVGFCED